jgi:ketosteroid isomerase-like protein
MPMRITLLSAILICGTLAFAGNCPAGQAKDQNVLLQIEQVWAQALEKHDADAVACILAAEFQDIDVEGKVHDRTEALARIAHRHPGTNQLSEMTTRVSGDLGYVRGLNTVMGADGKPVAQVRFTDIFLYREGRWAAVAAQESLVTSAAK